MRTGGSVYAGVWRAAALICWLCLSAGPGWADDDDEVRTLLFSGRDIWRNGVFAHSGIMFAPGGLDQDGYLFKLVLSGGLYRYTASTPDIGQYTAGQVYGFESAAQFLAGFRIRHGNFEAKFFMGPEIEEHRLWPDDPMNQLRGQQFGMRVAAEFWLDPTPTTMAAFDASLSTFATNHSMRIAYGWRVLDDQFYLGPEFAYIGGDGYRHFRLGAHMTGLKIDNYEWSAAGGYARDSEGRASPYVRLGMLQRM